jgi:cytidylate kinase
MLWRELINAAAARAGAPEMALVAIDELNLLGITPSSEARRQYHRSVQSVLHEQAAEGNVVIVGRASQVILRDFPGALHVRLIAPVDVRVQRVSVEKGISLEASRATIEASDQNRRSYLRRYYHVNWGDPVLYDLVINTEHISVALAAEMICCALKKAEPAA